MSGSYFYAFIWMWIGLAIIVFPFALRIIAPYGRHIRTGWGPMMDNKLGWIIYESPALILVACYFLMGTATKTSPAWIMFSLYMLHYINRAIIYPLRIRTQGKKIPLGIVISAFGFNLVNGSIIGYFLGFVQNYAEDWMNDPRFIIGILLFFTGMSINWQSDTILINLRKPGETDYKIPNRGLFKFVSCPNHMGEIIEWTGFAIMLWALPGLSFVIWTFANLVPRALNHHLWYRDKFEDYPVERRAVFPYIL